MSSPLKTPNMEPQNPNLPHLQPSACLTSPSTLSAAAPRASKRRLEEVSEEVNNDFLQPDEQEFFKSFPPGYRFNPNDEELVLYYLRKKVKNEKLPPNQMVDVDIYKHNPEFLAERYKEFGEDRWYFFTPRDRKYKNGKRPKRSAGDGYWKATGADKHIYYKEILIGYRKALVFYKGQPKKGDKTNWIMHEFRVSEPSSRTKRSPDDMRLDDWVLCRIYKKPEKQKDKEDFESREEEDNDHDDDHDGSEHMEVESRSTSAVTDFNGGPESDYCYVNHGGQGSESDYCYVNHGGQGSESDYCYVNQTFPTPAFNGGQGPESSDYCYANQTFPAPAFNGDQGPESDCCYVDQTFSASTFNEPLKPISMEDSILNFVDIPPSLDFSTPNIPPSLDFSYMSNNLPSDLSSMFLSMQ